jgi:hypothetical protein
MIVSEGIYKDIEDIEGTTISSTSKQEKLPTDSDKKKRPKENGHKQSTDKKPGKM